MLKKDPQLTHILRETGTVVIFKKILGDALQCSDMFFLCIVRLVETEKAVRRFEK